MKTTKTRFELRCTEKQYNRIQLLANIYSKGNMSAYILNQALEARREYVKGKRANKRKIKKAVKNHS